MQKIFILFIALLMIFQSCSSNKGDINTVQNPVLLSDTSTKASCVFLSGDERNNPVVSWIQIDSAGIKSFYFANWDPKTRAFSAAVPVPTPSNTSVHEEGMPKIAIKGKDTIVAIFETSVPMKNSRFGLSDIHYIMSFDNGKRWTEPKSIQSDTSRTGSRSFGDMVRLSNGAIGVTWLGTDPNNVNHARPVYFARTNGNEGFGKAILIEHAGCQCCRTALSSDEKGNISVVFRDLLPGSVRDISISSSADDGQSFSKSVPFSNDHWVIDGCPHDGPSVVSKDAKSYVAWFTGAQNAGVFYAELDKNNHMVAKRLLDPNGRFVQLCLTPDGTRIVAYNVEYQQK
ncbi:sialidase family protein, partial [Arachidicoccus sp.]|uniref:sialidase family protein n=1 Tax=Arachidicoccus sp. TaxID=1872624 RepID=UPI003D1EB078